MCFYQCHPSLSDTYCVVTLTSGIVVHVIKMSLVQIYAVCIGGVVFLFFSFLLKYLASLSNKHFALNIYQKKIYLHVHVNVLSWWHEYCGVNTFKR